MKLKYLGTAAAEGIPAIFCNCETCRESRKRGGKNIRTRSQAMIDDRLLIDFPADTYLHMLQHNLDLYKVNTCLITHSHSDHLYVQELDMRKKGFAYLDTEPLTFYSSRAGYLMLKQQMLEGDMEDGERVRAVRIRYAFRSFEADGYTITPMMADHDMKRDPVIYAIEKDGKSLLYGHDTGYFPDSTWDYLENSDIYYDCISLDCTEFYSELRRGHMSFECCKEVRDRLMQIGAADAHTIFVLNHFSHNGKGLHEEMERDAKEAGFLVSYDGMEVVF